MRRGFARQDAAIEFVNDAGHIGARFTVGWNSVVFINGGGAGVICGEGEREIVVIAGEQPIEIGGAAADILVRLKTIFDAEARRGTGHELHEALRACTADGMNVAAALCFDDASKQIDIYIVHGACLSEHLVEIAGREMRKGICRKCYGRRSGGFGRGRIGNDFESDNLRRRELDVAVFTLAEIEADSALDLGVMIAAQSKAVGEGGLLRGASLRRKRGEDREWCDGDAERTAHG